MTAARLEFEVPLPPMALSPNNVVGSIGQRMAKHVRYEAYREQVRGIAIAAARRVGWEPPEKARISLTYCVQTGPGGRKAERFGNKLDWPYRPEDWDNAVGAFKAGQDGLVQHLPNAKHPYAVPGVLVADDKRHLVGGPVEFETETGPCVRVVLEVVG